MHVLFCHLDKAGGTIAAEIAGRIDCCVRLSGTPDLNLSFVNPRIMDDVSLHPCVRGKHWETEKLLSFVPPDGYFCLKSHHVSFQSVVAILRLCQSEFLPSTRKQSSTDGKAGNHSWSKTDKGSSGKVLFLCYFILTKFQHFL